MEGEEGGKKFLTLLHPPKDEQTAKHRQIAQSKSPKNPNRQESQRQNGKTQAYEDLLLCVLPTGCP